MYKLVLFTIYSFMSGMGCVEPITTNNAMVETLRDNTGTTEIHQGNLEHPVHLSCTSVKHIKLQDPDTTHIREHANLNLTYLVL